MKAVNIIISAIILMAILPMVSATECYQEQTNQSSLSDGNCSLNYSGKYLYGTYYNMGSYSLTEGVLYPQGWNGNWEDYADLPNTERDYVMVYPMPIGKIVNGAIWQVKLSSDGGEIFSTANYSIPSICINGSSDFPNSIVIDMFNDGSGNLYLQCNVFELLDDFFSGYTFLVSEEAMIWNVTESSPSVANATISIVYPTNTTYNSTVNNLSYEVSDADACWYSTNLGVTNNSITCGNNVTGLNANTTGNYTWRVYANNSENTIESDEIKFSVSIPSPSPSPSPTATQSDVIAGTLTSAGTGLAVFISAITNPLVFIALNIAIIGVLVGLVYFFSVWIKGVIKFN